MAPDLRAYSLTLSVLICASIVVSTIVAAEFRKSLRPNKHSSVTDNNTLIIDHQKEPVSYKQKLFYHPKKNSTKSLHLSMYKQNSIYTDATQRNPYSDENGYPAPQPSKPGYQSHSSYPNFQEHSDADQKSSVSAAKSTHNSFLQASDPTAESHYDGTLLGSEFIVNQETALLSHSSSNNGSLSRDELNNRNQQASRSHSYRSNEWLSRGGLTSISQQKALPSHSPRSNGIVPEKQTNKKLEKHRDPASNDMNSGQKRAPQESGLQDTSLNTDPPSPAMNVNREEYSHIYIRNGIGVNINNKIRTTLYHYEPPTHKYYASDGTRNHYPVYKYTLPAYVFEYRQSKSRFNVLLTGLALYNLGILSKKHVLHNYYKRYKHGGNEICRFGIDYDSFTNDEVDIDCRLITNFVWSVKHTNISKVQVNAPNANGLAHPQLIRIESVEIIDALDPQFDGVSLELKSDMKCYMKYYSGIFFPTTKYISCGLLQTYGEKSFYSDNKIASTLLLVVAGIGLFIFLLFLLLSSNHLTVNVSKKKNKPNKDKHANKETKYFL